MSPRRGARRSWAWPPAWELAAARSVANFWNGSRKITNKTMKKTHIYWAAPLALAITLTLCVRALAQDASGGAPAAAAADALTPAAAPLVNVPQNITDAVSSF